MESAMLKRHVPEPGPERVGEVLSRLFTARGWGRRQAHLQVERAWEEAAGAKLAEHTRLINLRRGVMEIEVNSAILLQELAHFHKRKLLEQLRKRLPNLTIADLRFRAGTWDN
jgi:predicted nucleic acid-binding Zn ribbon protein